MTSLFGTLEYVDLNSDSTIIDPYSIPITNGYPNLPSNSNETNCPIIQEINNSLNQNEQTSLSYFISNVEPKKLLWQIDYFSVPYYVRIYDNELFICDKYGLKY